MNPTRYLSLLAVAAGIGPSLAFTGGHARTTPTSPLAASASASASAAEGTTLRKECTLDGKRIRGPITPLGNFVLVRTRDTLDATDGGILLPDQSKERPTEGEVVAAGPGKLHPHTGVRITNPVAAGDSVLFGKFDVVAGSVMAAYQPCEGKVVKIGEGRMTSKGDFSLSPVKVGDRVKFRDYAGNGVKIEGVEHSLVRMVDILCGLEA